MYIYVIKIQNDAYVETLHMWDNVSLAFLWQFENMFICSTQFYIAELLFLMNIYVPQFIYSSFPLYLHYYLNFWNKHLLRFTHWSNTGMNVMDMINYFLIIFKAWMLWIWSTIFWLYLRQAVQDGTHTLYC